VLHDEVVDVALVARLRPAALIVPARDVVALVDDLLEPAVGEAVDRPALAGDDGDQGAVVSAEAAGDRAEVERAADLDGVADRLRQR
jgi:hypothetical protein